MVISFLDELDKTVVNVVVFIMMWLIYPFLFMLIISNFRMTKYHKKIQELLFSCYITAALSGFSWIQIQHLVDPKKASAWNMRKRVKNGLTLKFRSESEVRIAAKKLFHNVAKQGSEFIELEDLARFLPENDALATLSILEETSEGETTKISCSSLQDWMVYVFRLEMSLVLSMKDTDSIIRSMTIIVHLVLVIALAISLVPVVLDGYYGYIIYFFFVSLAFLAVRKSRESRSFHDSIMLFFFHLPFDVGESCLIDDVEFVVKKVNFFSTTFIGLDNKEYIFSSTTLMAKKIGHFLGRSRLEKIQLIKS